MKIKYLISMMLLFSVCFVSCDLGYNELATTDEEWVYDSPIYGVERLVTDVYAHVRYDLGKYDGAMSASTTDEADYAQSFSDIHKFYDGGWSSLLPFSDTWKNSYSGIASANTFLEKIDKISLEDYKYNQSGDLAYDLLKFKFDLFPHEVRFLRAYFYFELAKTYGDVPLVTNTLTADEANTVARTPVSEVFKFISDECDAIFEHLPVNYEDEKSKETGRATRMMALALKARTLLYAASLLFNKENDKELWKKAALASQVVIDKAPEWGITLSPYADLWGNDSHLNKELIFFRRTGATNTVEIYNYPVGIENGKSGNCPTQNLVDNYEYIATGKTWPETEALGELPADPYEGLDPRFGLSVVKHGDMWPSYNPDPIEITEGGRNAPPLLNATTTGYYLKKYCDGSVNISTNDANEKYHTWIVYRLSEFYLNYAEAVYNYLGDAEAKSSELKMSANEAINVLRSRSDIHMPLFSGNVDFEKRYMRERMVELAFEDHRFWDVRRWKKGSEFFTDICCINLTKSLNGEVIRTREYKKRLWDERNNLFPIPFTELKKNPNLIQNPGW